MSSHSRVVSNDILRAGGRPPRAALEIGHDVPPEPSWSCRETQSNSSVQFEFRKLRKSIAVSDRSTFRGCNIRTRRGAARSRADSEPYRLSKTGTRHRGSLQHIAADIGSCGDHDWLERQPDETLDCFNGSDGCVSQHQLANSGSCADGLPILP